MGGNKYILCWMCEREWAAQNHTDIVWNMENRWNNGENEKKPSKNEIILFLPDSKRMILDYWDSWKKMHAKFMNNTIKCGIYQMNRNDFAVVPFI